MLIFGGNLLTGSFDSTDADAGAVLLSQGTSDFTGAIRIDETNGTLELNGTLRLFGSTSPVATTLSCETLRQ